MQQHLLHRIVNDPALTPDALRIVLFVHDLGEGWHRLKHPRLAILLNGRGEKPIRNACSNAAECGWLAWHGRGGTEGGYFRFRLPEETVEESEQLWMGGVGRAPGPPNPSPQGVNRAGNDSPGGVIPAPNASPVGVIPPGNDAPQGAIPLRNDAPSGVIAVNAADMGVIPGNDAPEGVIQRSSRAARVSSWGIRKQEEADEEEGAGVSVGVSPDAQALIHGSAEALGPAAEALERYLAGRSIPGRHYGYVRKVLAWIGGMGGRLQREDGTPVPVVELPDLIASALWDLLASDEGAMNRPVGDPANLWTKMQVLANPIQPGRGRAAPPFPGSEHARTSGRGDSGGARIHQGRAGTGMAPISAVVAALPVRGQPAPFPADAVEAWAKRNPARAAACDASALRHVGLDPDAVAAGRAALPSGADGARYRARRTELLLAAMNEAADAAVPAGMEAA